MLKKIGYRKIAGKPLFRIVGILAFLSFLFTATVPSLIREGILQAPFQLHFWAAYVSISLMVLHVALIKL